MLMRRRSLFGLAAGSFAVALLTPLKAMAQIYCRRRALSPVRWANKASGTTAVFNVLFAPASVSIIQTGVILENVNHNVSLDPNFPINSTVTWFAWTGTGSGLRPPLGQTLTVELSGAWKALNLQSGKTYFKRRVVSYTVNGGPLQFKNMPIESFDT